MAIVTTEEAEKVMKRCQIGTRNYNEANDLHAECYGTIGALVQERDMLRTGDTCARHCEGTAYRIAARQQQSRADDMLAQVERQAAQIAQLRALVERYRNETPLGHQPHMIAHLADEALDATATHNVRGEPTKEAAP